jgi:hypothetical protein
MMITTAQFIYNAETRTMVGEASELAGAEASYLEIMSTHTGRLIRFELAGVVRDGGGDVVGWRYQPLPYGAPCNVSQLVIFND